MSETIPEGINLLNRQGCIGQVLGETEEESFQNRVSSMYRSMEVVFRMPSSLRMLGA